MIFVVDDEFEWLEYYERLLSEYGVEGFSDGVAVMARMDEVVPELVVLDVMLTGPTGFAVLHEMQSYAELARVPVVLVSGVEIEDDLREYGVVAVLDKSKMTPRELLEITRKYCRPIRLREECSIGGIKSQGLLGKTARG